MNLIKVTKQDLHEFIDALFDRAPDDLIVQINQKDLIQFGQKLNPCIVKARVDRKVKELKTK